MSSAQPSDPQRKLIRADPTTIRGKFLVGYRGWYTCPGDGPPLVQGDEWAHWTDEQGRFNAQLAPDHTYYSPGDLATMPQAQHRLFSSRNPEIVRRHLNIMAMHGIDGLFLTRRGAEIAAAYQPGGNGLGVMKMRSESIKTIFRAAEQEGRVLSIMYDLSGMPSHQIEQWIAGDWEFMISQKHVLDSPSYIREHGAPVVALWGVGFKNANQDPHMILRLINRIRDMAGGAYIILGVPITWQKHDSNWQSVYQSADAIAPMCVGTLVDEEGVNNWSKDVQVPAVQSLRAGSKRTDYVGVVWPGHEGHLLTMGISAPQAPRQDGAFLWRQVYNARRDGVRLIYAEMLDGFDDGTAILPSIGGSQNSGTPPDWYLRICGYASEALKGEKHLYEELPRKELAEYWSTRPHYEEQQQESSSSPGPSGPSGTSESASGSGSGAQSSGPSLAPPARAPTRNMTADFGDAPPPYSLEAATPAADGGAFTAEPESVAPVAGPGPSSQAPYGGSMYDDRPVAPSNTNNARQDLNRVDSVQSNSTSSSYPGQHRPGPINVPEPSAHAIPVQTPGTYHHQPGPGPSQVPGGYPGSNPSSPPVQSASLHRVESASAYGRPPQHPAAASRPPPVAARPPSRPGRPQSASSNSSRPSNPASPPIPPVPSYDPNRPAPSPQGSVHQLAEQMHGMNVGGPSPNRPAPEHVFAGVGFPAPHRPHMPGMPSSPFEGVNLNTRYGEQGQEPGLFGQQQQPQFPPRHQQSQPGAGYGQGYDVPHTPVSGGNPLYPAPVQHSHGGHSPMHQGSVGPGQHPMGPVHQHSMGSAHQPTMGPTHQPTIGPTHQSTMGPAHQNTIGPGQHYPGPTHQATLGPSGQPGHPMQPNAPSQAPRPGQPPQPSFQASGPYVPHHQPTSPYTPPAPGGSPSQGYFGPGVQSPGPASGGHSSHSSGYPSPQPQPQAHGGWPSTQPGGVFHHPQAGSSYLGPPGPGSVGYTPHPGAQSPHPGAQLPHVGAQALHPGGPPQGYGAYSPQGGHQPQASGQSGHTPMIPGGQYIDSALGAVGKYAGEERKKQLEKGVATALNAGTKLWGKFSK